MAPRLPLIHTDWATVLLVIASAAVWLITIGCTDPESAENEQLRNEIILVHDQAMVQTSQIFDLQARLKIREDDPHADHTTITQLIDTLKEADRAMFAWMNQYQTLFVDDDITVDNAYRRAQLEAIRSISRTTDQAVAEAERFIAASGQ